MSLLTMVQNVCNEVGLEQPSAAYSSTAVEVKQIIRFLYRTYQDLNLRGHWSELIREHAITLSSGTTAYSYPTDLDRMIYETEWDGDRQWRLFPVSPTEWETMYRGISTASNVIYFTARGTTSNRFIVHPTPGADDDAKNLFFLYISTKWIQASDGTDKSAFTADTDISLLPEDLVELGAKWRYKAENKLDYGEDRKLYEVMIPTKLKAKSSSRTLKIYGSRFNRHFIDNSNLSEGNYGA